MKKTIEEIRDELAQKYYHDTYEDLCHLRKPRIKRLAQIEYDKQFKKD